MNRNNRLLLMATLGVLIGAMMFLTTLRAAHRHRCHDHLHFQILTSECMQQTLSVIDLRENPVSAFWYLHIQPPGFDLIRAALVAASSAKEWGGLMRDVDEGLYNVFTIFYGLGAALLFYWVWSMTRPALAAPVAFLFAVHPATLYYATFLDGVFVSSILILFFFVVLWWCIAHRCYTHVLALATLALFFFRSNFQWPFLVVVAASLWLARIPSAVGRFLKVTVPVVMLYLLKQYIVFGLTLTTSFSGLSMSHTVHLFPDYGANPHLDNPRYDTQDLPPVVKRRRKADQAPNLNHVSYLRYNRELLASASAKLREDGWRSQCNRYWENMVLFFLPSSLYSQHVIVDVLPWRGWFDFAFSEGRLVVLLLSAAFIWFALRRREGLRAGLALGLPAAFVFATCILFDRGETLRFKWLLEPVFLVFIVHQYHAVWKTGAKPPTTPALKITP